MRFAAAGVGWGWGEVGFLFGGFVDGRRGFRRERVGFAVFGDSFGYGVFEFVQAFSGDGGDGEEGEFAAGGEGFEAFEFVGVGGVEFGGDEEGGFSGEGGVEAAELVGDDAVVFYGVGGLDWRRDGRD